MRRFCIWMKGCNHRQVDAAMLQGWVDFLCWKHKHSTAMQGWNATRRFLRWLRVTGYTDQSPQEGVRIPISNDQPCIRAATPEEYRSMLAACGEHWMGWAVMLGWNTGMSIADCMKLKWGDVDMQSSVITIRRRKTHRQAIIPFDPSGELGRRLAAMYKGQDCKPDPESYVCREAGSRLKEHAPQFALAGMNSFAKIARRAGLDGLQFHMFRRAFVSALANSNMNTAVACKVTGHANPRIFAQYVRPDVAMIRHGVLNALNARGAVDDVDVPPPEYIAKPSDGGLLRPRTVYLARKGRVFLPDGTPVSHVRTGDVVDGRSAVVTACDEQGDPTSDARLVVDLADVRSFN